LIGLAIILRHYFEGFIAFGSIYQQDHGTQQM
jgi:hypothetical protein